MKFNIRPNRPPDLFLADFEIEFNQPLKTRKISNIIVRDIQIATDSTTPITAKRIIGCGGLGEALAQRIMFTSNATWTVPVGVRRAFVTMAAVVVQVLDGEFPTRLTVVIQVDIFFLNQ